MVYGKPVMLCAFRGKWEMCEGGVEKSDTDALEASFQAKKIGRSRIYTLVLWRKWLGGRSAFLGG
jgi:hypothetical protein